MRQRHSQDDLEDDDACPITPPPLSSIPRAKTWIEVLENVLWIASAVFIVYYGDGQSNLIHLLWQDDRIRRMPLYLGIVGAGLNTVIFIFTSMLPWSWGGINKFGEKWSALPVITLLGLISFCLFCFALWPIWSFFSIPLLFTLFMASMVLTPYIMMATLKPQTEGWQC